MKPDLKQLLQERFQGHEADVDPGLWDAIQNQIAIAAPATDAVENIFRDRFQHHEVHVDPGVWNAISSQIGHGAVAGTAATGGSFFSWFAAASAVVVLTVGAYLYTGTDAPAELAQNSAGKTEQETQVIEILDQPQVEVEIAIQPATATDGSDATEVQPSSAGAPVNAEPKQAASATPADPTNRSNSTPTTIDPTPNKIGDPVIQAHSRKPEEGTAVVNGVIEQLAQEVHLEAIAAPQVDHAGPPPVEVENGALPNEAVLTPPSSGTELPEIFIPNTFTPNGDGINDTYSVSREGFKSMMIRIYSIARNTLVFSTDSNEEWDGADSEKGYYLVAIEAVTEDGRVVTKGKAVWLNNDRY